MSDFNLLSEGFPDFESKSDLLQEEFNFEVTVPRQPLLSALTYAQAVTEKRNIIPILSNVKLECKDGILTVSATDMDIFISEKIKIDSKSDAALTVPGHMLYDIVRKLPSGSEINLKANYKTTSKLFIESSGCKFELPFLPANEFPNFDYSMLDHNFKISSAELLNLIDKNRLTIAEESRYNLYGIYFHVKNTEGRKMLRAVATDGHRLAMAEVDLPEMAENMPGVIIPKKTVLELKRILEDVETEVTVSVSESKVKFYINDIVLITKLIDASFPDYEGLVPAETNHFVRVDREAFANAVDRVTTIAFEKSRALKLTISNNEIELIVLNENNGKAREVVPAESNCDSMQIGFNARYIIESLSVMSDPTVEFRFIDSFSPAIFACHGNSSFIHVIMPMRV